MQRLILAPFLVVALIFVAAAQARWTASPLDVVINEIAWSGTAVSPSDEWIELYNNTASPINLSGWTLSAADGSPSVALSGSIPAGGYFLLERSNDDSVPEVPADLIYTGSLGNNGEDLVLRDDASNLIDRVDASAGWLAGHGDGRVPMVRLDTLADGSQANNWEHNPRCGHRPSTGGSSERVG